MKNNLLSSKLVLTAALGLVLLSAGGCSSARFNINNVDFSYEDKPEDLLILPLKYHDRSNLNSEAAGKIMNSILAKDSSGFYGYYYIEHKVDKSETKILDIGSIGLIMDILHVFGFPKARVHYDLTADAYLFDSKGSIVEIYEKKSSIMKYRGWYYGYGVPVKDLSNEYKKMFYEITKSMGASKKRTNYLLTSSGALSEENTAEIYTRIYMIIK